jgi:hypothetical protein
MNAREQARFDMLKRVADFGENNANDFKPVPPATQPTKAQRLFGEVDDAIAGLADSAAGQQSGAGDFHAGTTSKSVQRDGLLAELRSINRSAGAIADAQSKPEIMESFRMPRGNNDTTLVAKTRAFADAAEPLKDAFIELEHPANFIEALRQRVSDFANADSAQNTGLQDRSGATASIGPKLDAGLKAVKQLDALMHNKYAGTPEKLAAWFTASNVTRPSTVAKQNPSPNPVPAATPPKV